MRFGRLGHRELLCVGGALLGLDENAEVHSAQRRTAQKKSTRSVLMNMPCPVESLVNVVPVLSATIVQPTAP